MEAWKTDVICKHGKQMLYDDDDDDDDGGVI